MIKGCTKRAMQGEDGLQLERESLHPESRARANLRLSNFAMICLKFRSNNLLQGRVKETQPLPLLPLLLLVVWALIQQVFCT